MASNYPAALDSLSNPDGGDALSTGHAAQHGNVNDAVEAIEGELGTDPAGASATVKARLDANDTAVALKAPLASPTFTGTVTLPTGTVTSGMILDGTIVNADVNASAAIDITKLSGAVASSTIGNLLTANQATVETDLTGFGVHASTTTTRSSDFAWQGTYSAKVVTDITGASNLGVPAASPYQQIPVTPGQTYTASAMVYQSIGTRPLTTTIYWYQANGTSAASTATNSNTSSTPTAAWSRQIVTAVAPGNAAYARVLFNISATNGAAGDTMYFDAIGFWPGAAGQWAPPGSVIASDGFYTDESVGRRIFHWDRINARYQMTYGDTGLRTGATTLASGFNVLSGIDHLSRYGNTVQYTAILEKTGTGQTINNADTIFTLPAGFRPSVHRYNDIGSVRQNFAPAGASLFIYVSTGVTQYAGSNSTGLSSPNFYVNVIFRTNDAWPTTLPGSASGAIPTG